MCSDQAHWLGTMKCICLRAGSFYVVVVHSTNMLLSVCVLQGNLARTCTHRPTAGHVSTENVMSVPHMHLLAFS
jgi:hypothetical protein